MTHEKEIKKNTSLRLDAQTLRELKMIALEKETSVQAILERLIKDLIEEEKLKR